MGSTVRNLLGVCVLLAGCSGSGGGGNNPPPVLIGAAFNGVGSTPAAGDFLLLYLSEAITVATGKLLDSADLQLSSGSLGAISAAPVQITSSAVRVTLGPGVSFVPGTTTIAFRPENDVVFDAGGAKPTSNAMTITPGDGLAPALTQVSIEGIEDAMNGEGPAGGRMQVPVQGFSISLGYFDNGGIDHARTVIRSSWDVVVGGLTRTAGTNLAPDLQATTSASSSSYFVPGSVVFPAAALDLTAQVFDLSGLGSIEVTFPVTVKPFSDATRPFETNVNPSQLWYLDLTRDVESYTYAGGSGNTVVATQGANGRPDFDDLLLILGLHGSDGGVNTTVSAQLRQRIQENLAALYPGVNLTVTFSSPGTFPGGQNSVAYASLGWSQICIAGVEDPANQTSGVLGVALFDPSNATQNNNCLLNFGGAQRLGVFLHTVATFGLRPPGSSLFRTTFDAFVPGALGTPIGNFPDGFDDERLAGTQVDARQGQIDAAIRGWARIAAVVTAHECGHSMGLVKNGAMPVGLYGGDPVNFPGSSSGHIRNTGFPAGASNVMSPAISYDSAQHAGTAFNSLNLAYLRERVHHDQ